MAEQYTQHDNSTLRHSNTRKVAVHITEYPISQMGERYKGLNIHKVLIRSTTLAKRLANRIVVKVKVHGYSFLLIDLTRRKAI
ncbi:hypothetical protein D1872_271940 [compost metagenome]